MDKKFIITGFKNSKNKKKFLDDIEKILNKKNKKQYFQSIGGGQDNEKENEICRELFFCIYSNSKGLPVTPKSLAPKNALKKTRCNCVNGPFLNLTLFKVTSKFFPDLKYSIHGLWPTECINRKMGFQNMINFVRKDGSNSFQVQDISFDTIKKANKFWFSFGGSPPGVLFETPPSQFKRNADFWAHEWNIHGTYLQTINKFKKMTPEKYMVTTIDLYEQATKENEDGISLADKFYNKKKQIKIPVNLNFEFICTDPTQKEIKNICC